MPRCIQNREKGIGKAKMRDGVGGRVGGRQRALLFRGELNATQEVFT